jgi:hypothetical protein
MQHFKCQGFYLFFYYVFNGDIFIQTYPIMDKVIGNVSFDRAFLYRKACHVLQPTKGNWLNATVIVHSYCTQKKKVKTLHRTGNN